MREVFFLIGRGGAVLYADASDSPVRLPDARSRWEAIWAHRDELEVLAHSHPAGPQAFSSEDESTMRALDSALGVDVRYMVVAPKATIVRVGHAGDTIALDDEPWWVALMRLSSGMKG